jgi:hypothetical protein
MRCGRAASAPYFQSLWVRRWSRRATATTSCGTTAPRFSVAPMREYTDRHLRRMLRLMSSEAVLWSEMEKAEAILERSGRGQGRQLERLLKRGTEGAGLEVLQLGGDDPNQLSRATLAALPFGYDEVRYPATGDDSCVSVHLLVQPRTPCVFCQRVETYRARLSINQALEIEYPAPPLNLTELISLHCIRNRIAK